MDNEYLGLGMGGSRPAVSGGFCPALVSGRTIVFEGIV